MFLLSLLIHCFVSSEVKEEFRLYFQHACSCKEYIPCSQSKTISLGSPELGSILLRMLILTELEYQEQCQASWTHYHVSWICWENVGAERSFDSLPHFLVSKGFHLLSALVCSSAGPAWWQTHFLWVFQELSNLIGLNTWVKCLSVAVIRYVVKICSKNILAIHSCS